MEEPGQLLQHAQQRLRRRRLGQQDGLHSRTGSNIEVIQGEIDRGEKYRIDVNRVELI